MADAPQVPSLFERLGGIFGIARIIDVLGDRLYDNDTLNRNPAVMRLHDEKGRPGFKFTLIAWMIEQTGGPKVYPGADMRTAHAEMTVSDFEFDVVLWEAAAVLTYCGVPQQEHKELMAVLESVRDDVRAGSAA
ncbi:MAG: hemoglobin [Actinomycetota bacterium]|nr:hemoglobin [Actinomycetota bacterium]